MRPGSGALVPCGWKYDWISTERRWSAGRCKLTPHPELMSVQSRANWGLFLLRVGLASLLIGLHGGPRLMRAARFLVLGEPWTFVGLVEGMGLPFPLMFALLSTAADSVGAFLVGLGFLTRWAALMVATNMTVAVYFEMTGGDPIELPAMYLLGAVVLVVTGAGAYSVDAVRSARSI